MRGLLTVYFLCFWHSPPLCASLPAVGNAWWRCVSCCRAILLGNKALVWTVWQVVKISSAWEMPVFPSTFCLLLSIICEQQTADVSPSNKGSVCVCVCVSLSLNLFVWACIHVFGHQFVSLRYRCVCVHVCAWNRCCLRLATDRERVNTEANCELINVFPWRLKGKDHSANIKQSPSVVIIMCFHRVQTGMCCYISMETES